MKKAVILLATYNGEKYLEELLDSLVNQTYPNVQIYIRDDCSNDSTKDILYKYRNKYNNVHVKIGKKNLGYPACFYALTDNAPKSDYYFFADQDDVWFLDKVEKAIKKMEELNGEVIAYYSGYKICNNNLDEVGKSKFRNNILLFHNTSNKVL